MNKNENLSLTHKILPYILHTVHCNEVIITLNRVFSWMKKGKTFLVNENAICLFQYNMNEVTYNFAYKRSYINSSNLLTTLKLVLESIVISHAGDESNNRANNFWKFFKLYQIIFFVIFMKKYF